MWNLPDVIRLGPFPLNSSILTVALGAVLFQWWLGRRARRSGYDPDLAGDIASSVLLCALGGAKLLDIVLFLPSYLGSPGLLIVLPGGWTAWAGGLLGAAACLGWFRYRRGADLIAWADLAAVPSLAALGLAMLGRPVPHATVVGAGLALAAAALQRLSRFAAFPGHLALGAVVLGSFALAATDLFGPGGARLFGIPRLQAGAIAAGAAAYLAAVRLGRRADKDSHRL